MCLSLANYHRVVMQLCYCSLYDDCWISATHRRPDAGGRLRVPATCSNTDVPDFQVGGDWSRSGIGAK